MSFLGQWLAVHAGEGASAATGADRCLPELNRAAAGGKDAMDISIYAICCQQPDDVGTAADGVRILVSGQLTELAEERVDQLLRRAAATYWVSSHSHSSILQRCYDWLWPTVRIAAGRPKAAARHRGWRSNGCFGAR
jgi:hypothetical protein